MKKYNFLWLVTILIVIFISGSAFSNLNVVYKGIPPCDTIKLKDGTAIVANVEQINTRKVIYTKCYDAYLGTFNERVNTIDTVIWDSKEEVVLWNEMLITIEEAQKPENLSEKYNKVGSIFLKLSIVSILGGAAVGTGLIVLDSWINSQPSTFSFNSKITGIGYIIAGAIGGGVLIYLGIKKKRKSVKKALLGRK